VKGFKDSMREAENDTKTDQTPPQDPKQLASSDKPAEKAAAPDKTTHA